MAEVNSIAELVAGAEQDLQRLADAGNSVAQTWLEAIRETDDANTKLYQLSAMKISLRGFTGPMAQAVYQTMFGEE